jgi:hypothetical protein
MVPVMSRGRALHRVSSRGDTQPGDESLAVQMRLMSFGEYKYIVLRNKRGMFSSLIF